MCNHAKAEAEYTCRQHNRTSLLKSKCRWVMNIREQHCRSKSMAHVVRLHYTNIKVAKTEAYLH